MTSTSDATRAAAIFNAAYASWLCHNNFKEEPYLLPKTRSNKIVNQRGVTSGIITRTQTIVRLHIPWFSKGGLTISRIDYLSAPYGYQIKISERLLSYCWLGHRTNDICKICLAAKHDLRTLRAVGCTWLLTDVLRDIKLLIARLLSQLGAIYLVG